MSPLVQVQVAALREKLQRLPRSGPDGRVSSTGVPALDGLLPWGGLRCGSLVEYLAGGEASGAGLLALAAARAACTAEQAFVVVDRRRQFYPPAAASSGIDLGRTIVLQPTQPADELWALDQALRCTGVGAVWISCGQLDGRVFRRLALAAESGGTLGLLVRPQQVRRRPTWAEVQWVIAPRPSRGAWRLSVELVRCPGGAGGGRVDLELDEQTGLWREVSEHAADSLHSFAQLADSADQSSGIRVG